MAEQDPRNAIDSGDDDLSVEELEHVSGGTDTNNSGCTSNGNCPCKPGPGTLDPAPV